MKFIKQRFSSFFVLISLIAMLFGLSSPVLSQAEGPNKVYLPFVAKQLPSPTPTHFSTSWYVTPYMFRTTGTKSNMYYKGLQAAELTRPPGKQDQLVILNYGRPKYVSGVYGTRILSSLSTSFTSFDQIIGNVQDYILGYMAGTAAIGDYESHLELGVGTNNINWYYYADRVCSGYFCTTAEAYNHGKAWALMIGQLNDWVIRQGLANRVSVAGASDIELSWNTAAISHAWVKGFDDHDRGFYIFYNFGACEGCDVGINLTRPPDPNKKLTGDWTHAKVHYSAWQAGSAWPIPEIYLNNGWNANQWANISKVGTMLGYYKMYFFSTLTQYQACQSVDDPYCSSTDNTPQEGATQLLEALNTRPETAQDSIPYLTDIDWP